MDVYFLLSFFKVIAEDATNNYKTILFWNTWFFGKADVEKDLFITFEDCPVNCRIIHNRSLVNESDAIFFHIATGDKLGQLPTHRRPNQRYVFLTLESPESEVTDRNISRNIPPHFFNWTATYRLDSDLIGNSCYGWKFQPKKTPVSSRRPGVENYYGINITGKTKTAAWFVSHCKTKVNREGYVLELQKHVPVDVFGNCLPNSKSCPRTNQSQCDDMLRREYLFYLSFENSFCPDYVTEKFYRAFQTGTVPVVFGGANYSNFAPPHSYINARDFGTPQLLADYLLKLSQNRDLYARFFDWRGEFDLLSNVIYSKERWCDLCKMLHDPTWPAKSYPDIEKWWYEDRPCENYRWLNTKG